eukprot:TRINITY_DN32551_c0_g1_i1.p1 TRINITY_DN32551_c0_g1~~TRINITY_DN32551_c0_g1_i1.p1  ORF type:complete len:748 (-),score=129.37 TRINITY_DN32551_c0_g1_i1:498-2741(-)
MSASLSLSLCRNAVHPRTTSIPNIQIARSFFKSNDCLRHGVSIRPCELSSELFETTAIVSIRQRIHGLTRGIQAAGAASDGTTIVEKKYTARPRVAATKPKEKDERLMKLREEMRKANGGEGVDAYIIPSEDPHQSEYSSPRFQRRKFISRFSGSAGTAVVTHDHAALWTDGRYFLQAAQQLGPEWTLMRSMQVGVPDLEDWLKDTLPENSRVGIDPYLHSTNSVRDLASALAQRGSVVVPVVQGEREDEKEEDGWNLVDRVWGSELPPSPPVPLRVHPLTLAGKSVDAKLSEIRKELKEAGATGLVVSLLDEVMWLFNLRGGDIPHSPVTFSYGLVEMEAATFFVEEAKLTPDVKQHLAEAGVTVKPYSALAEEIRRAAAEGVQLLLDPARISYAVAGVFEEACEKYFEAQNGGVTGDGTRGPAIIARPSPVSLAKAIKNSAELEGMRQAHLRDGAALAEFWAWLEGEVASGRAVSEVEVGTELEKFRAKQEGFLDTSFDTIAGSGPNGAIIHYSAEEATCGTVTDKKMLLLDSGGQYVDGTTDITRTVHLGQPNGYQKNCFTRVLKGHIALDQAIFPEGSPGFVLDVLARSALWQIGLDYRHGTGHGVGAALNVHEGPQGISPRFGNLTGLQPGMIISNEPGYYEDGSFGIRIENLVAVREEETPNRFGGNSFLGFEKLSFCPIQVKMIDFSLMSDSDVAWLNDYHAAVRAKIAPRVQGKALEWLLTNTQAVDLKGAIVDKSKGV